MRKYWRRFLAYWRLSLKAVCEESRDRGPWDDFHDYPDSTIGYPWHMHSHTCKRCGKSFYI
jgi:hypothetical protein